MLVVVVTVFSGLVNQHQQQSQLITALHLTLHLDNITEQKQLF